MGVYAKGMDMPKSCWDCSCMANFRCNLTKNCIAMDGRLANCPLVEEPKHGRLIDADALETRIKELYCSDCERRKGVKKGKMRMLYEVGDAPCRACGTYDALSEIDDAPTVIEGE